MKSCSQGEIIIGIFRSGLLLLGYAGAPTLPRNGLFLMGYAGAPTVPRGGQLLLGYSGAPTCLNIVDISSSEPSESNILS